MRVLFIGPSGEGKSFQIRRLLVALKAGMADGTVTPAPIIANDMDEEYKDLADLCIVPMDWDYIDYSDLPRGCILVLDEVDAISDNSRANIVRQIFNYSRKRNMKVLAASRRPHAMHPDVRTNYTKVVLFRPETPEDAGYLAKWLGPKTAEEAQRLGKHEYTTKRR